MTRPQSSAFPGRRDKILGDAIRLFADCGYAGGSMEELSRRSGMSKSLLYHYFTSKEQILVEGLSFHMRNLLGLAETVEQRSAPPADKLRLLIRALLRCQLEAPSHHRLLLCELPRLPEKSSEGIIVLQRKLTALVTRLLGELKPSLVDDGLAGARTMILFGMINWSGTWFSEDGAADIDDIADLITAIAVRGLQGLTEPQVAALGSQSTPVEFVSTQQQRAAS